MSRHSETGPDRIRRAIEHDRGMDAPQFPIRVCGPECRGETPAGAGAQPRPGVLKRWIIARRLGLRCLVCNRRAGYGGSCRNSEHNA